MHWQQTTFRLRNITVSVRYMILSKSPSPTEKKCSLPHLSHFRIQNTVLITILKYKGDILHQPSDFLDSDEKLNVIRISFAYTTNPLFPIIVFCLISLCASIFVSK